MGQQGVSRFEPASSSDVDRLGEVIVWSCSCGGPDDRRCASPVCEMAQAFYERAHG